MHVWDDDTACADVTGNNSAFEADVPVIHEWTSGRFVRLKLVRSQSAALLTSSICPTTSIHLQSPCELFKFLTHKSTYIRTHIHTNTRTHSCAQTCTHSLACTHTYKNKHHNSIHTHTHPYTQRHPQTCVHTHTFTLVHTHSICISILTHTTFWNSPQAIKWVETAIECFLLFTHCAVY